MTTSHLTPGYVLVGVGTSPASTAALRWAAAEAVRRDAVLYAVHVVPPTPSNDVADARRRVPGRVGDRLSDACAPRAVAVQVVTGDPAEQLASLAGDASVVVIGQPTADAHADLPPRLRRTSDVVMVVDTEGHARHIGSKQTAPTATPVVRDIMASPALTVGADDLLTRAVRRLDRHEVTSLPVVERDGRLVGVVSEADVVKHLVAGCADRDVLVRSVMSSAVWTVSPDDPLQEVAALFCRTSLKSLPVVHHARVVGVISRRDLVRASARHELPVSLDPAG
jgi:CBS domain-containing protein